MAELSSEAIIEKVMNTIEAFYFDDGPESGEQIFKTFADKHDHLFPDDFDADSGDNKLEYTTIFNEFQAGFEAHIESKLFGNRRADREVRRDRGAVRRRPLGRARVLRVLRSGFALRDRVRQFYRHDEALQEGEAREGPVIS
jgi:hypothetical protein